MSEKQGWDPREEAITNKDKRAPRPPPKLVGMGLCSFLISCLPASRWHVDMGLHMHVCVHTHAHTCTQHIAHTQIHCTHAHMHKNSKRS